MTSTEFEKIYRQLLLPLSMFALRIIGDTDETEGLVDEVFMSAWLKIREGHDPDNMKAYLYRAVRNRCLSHLSVQQKKADLEGSQWEDVAEEDIDTSERDARLWKAIGSLPERCRQVFLLSKRDELSNKEIAEELGISTKTVENQMTKAYKTLRKAYGLSSSEDKSLTIPLFLLALLADGIA